MPRSSAQLTRVRSECAPLWRDGDTLQFGEHGDVRLRADEHWIEPLVSRLHRGIPLASFDVIAHGLGAPMDKARAVLETLRPVLRTDPPTAPGTWVEPVNLADSRVATWMRESLGELGIPSAVARAHGTVGVILIHGAAASAHVRDLVRADIPHLPVSFDLGGVTAGPIVVPGRTPCLACRDAHERDRDAAWPMLHSQRIARLDSPISRVLVAESARLIDRMLRLPDPSGRLVRFSADGRRTWSAVRFHEECRCRATSFRSPPGTATPRALHAPPPATKTA